MGRLRFGAVLALTFLSAPLAQAGDAPCAWPLWEEFKHLYVSDDGRVVDSSTPEAVTTSEGQAYALTFALAANDRVSFAKILRWTSDNLSAGDPSHRLPAWRWGKAADGPWMVLDYNSASDADLWMAYTLAQAGRLWHNTIYAAQARAMTALILRDEVAFIPRLGATVLPGPRGFVANGTWRLNASYVPIQVLRGLLPSSDSPVWTHLLESSNAVIVGSAPRGFAADWILYRQGEGVSADRITQGVGSYNAIRVYLWAGMLSEDDPLAFPLLRQLEPMAALAAFGAAPESIDTDTLEVHGQAPYGFEAALVPLMVHFKLDETVHAYRERVVGAALRDNKHYYNDVLTLFGLGWLDGHLRFDRHGDLRVRWSGSCHAD
jgi:endoglucanase